MLEDFIIEEIKRRDRVKELEDKRPMLEIEIEDTPKRNSKPQLDDYNRTVITIDLNIEDD
jgi:hypothetical protein